MKKSLIALVLAALASGCINGIDQAATGEKTSAVVVGVENGFAGPCPGALKDASDMAGLLGKYSSDVRVLKDAGATSAAVYAAMRRAAESDLAIIYFSGHGGSRPSVAADEADGADEYICCFDRGLLDDDIWKVVLSAKGCVFLIFDCCHSETMFRSPGVTMRRAASRLSSARGGKAPAMLCWSGCPDGSYSYGSADGGEFTAALLKYARPDSTYEYVWGRIRQDARLAGQQEVRGTKIGDFDSGRKIFR